MLIRWAPQGSAISRATQPDEWRWGLTEQLLAAIFDSTEVGNWQRGSGKMRDLPKPTVRPGVRPDAQTIGKGAVPMDEMAALLGWSTN